MTTLFRFVVCTFLLLLDLASDACLPLFEVTCKDLEGRALLAGGGVASAKEASESSPPDSTYDTRLRCLAARFILTRAEVDEAIPGWEAMMGDDVKQIAGLCL